ncbi:MAG TPA: GDSL-type esterase/lipase family protein [Thermoanaerobaculia bacterium]|nr:GDSL-type esterase/lipase family protein [Thermoanaerobaculia bacterium]
MKLVRTLAANVLAPLAVAALLFLGLEGGCRVALRLKTGAWPETRAAAYTRFVEEIGKAFRPHPLLVVAGRPDATLRAAGKVVHFNARGQRATNVRDLALPKPPGVFRIVCEGGSTTLDILSPDDASTWPARLGALLAPRADVANAGFTGWTSLESLVSLEIRDVDLSPDLVVVYSGVNDLQPAGHDPFTPDYSLGHLDLLPRVTGVVKVPVRLVSRSVFLEFLLGRLRPSGGVAPAEGFAPSFEWKGGPKRDDIPDAAVAVYERNLRSTIAVARAAGARTLLVSQSVRLRKGREAEDGAWIAAWTPGLTTKGYLAGLARYDAVARKLGAEGLALFFDPFAGGAFPDAAFADPVHFSPEGSDRFARALAAFLTSPAGPLGPR